MTTRPFLLERPLSGGLGPWVFRAACRSWRKASAPLGAKPCQTDTRSHWKRRFEDDLLWFFAHRLGAGIGEVVLAATVKAPSPVLGRVQARRSIAIGHDGSATDDDDEEEQPLSAARHQRCKQRAGTVACGGWSLSRYGRTTGLGQLGWVDDARARD